MSFLSSFRIGQQTVYPEELLERLKSFPLLENVGDAALRNLLSEANWFAVPGGSLLERGGEGLEAPGADEHIEVAPGARAVRPEEHRVGPGCLEEEDVRADLPTDLPEQRALSMEQQRLHPA